MQAVPNYQLTFETIGGTSVPVSYNSGQEGPPGVQGYPAGRTTSVYNSVEVYGVPVFNIVTAYPSNSQHGTAVIIPPSSAIMQFNRLIGEWVKVGEL